MSRTGDIHSVKIKTPLPVLRSYPFPLQLFRTTVWNTTGELLMVLSEPTFFAAKTHLESTMKKHEDLRKTT